MTVLFCLFVAILHWFVFLESHSDPHSALGANNEGKGNKKFSCLLSVGKSFKSKLK